MTTQLLLGGLVYSSPTVPDATALAIADGIVVWVGTDDVGRALHPEAQVIDLQGRFVSPAFVDSHVHLTDTGLALGGLDLSHTTSRTECLRELAAFLAADPSTSSGSGGDGDSGSGGDGDSGSGGDGDSGSGGDGSGSGGDGSRSGGDGDSGSGGDGSGSGAGDVVWGFGWDASAWVDAGPGEDQAPSTADLDAVAGPRAVYLARIDEHSAAASTALRARVDGLAGDAGYDEQAPLIAEAHHRVRAAARAMISPAGRRRAQLRALDHAAAHGIVAVHENGGPEISGIEDFASIAELDHPVQVRRYWGQCVASADEARAVVAETGAHAIGGDLFVDGALGSHTALLSAPYTDDPDTRGVSYLTLDQVRAHLRATTEAGIQAGFHVIGDEAAAIVAIALAEIADDLGTPALARCAHRLEHAEMVTPEQAELFARCGVVASMQPLFDAAWGGPGQLYEQRLGERGTTLNNFAALSKAGVGLAFSSDAPVCPIDPWATVRAAAHHHNPTSAISPRAAFAAATRGGWRAGGVNDGLTGMLVPGAPAHYAIWEVEDLVVAPSHQGVQRWSTDPRSRVPALPDVAPGTRLPQCVLTAYAGDVIYARDAR